MTNCAPPISIEKTATGKCFFNGDILGNIDGERGFTHRRAAGDDNQVAGLEAGCFFIEVGKPCRHAGNFIGIVARIKHIDALYDFFQQIGHLQKALLGFGGAFGDLKHFVFRLIQKPPRVPALRIVCAAGDFRPHFGELAHNGTLAYDFGVAADVGGRRGVLRQCNQIFKSACRFQFFVPLQIFLNRNHICGTALID